MSHDHDILPQSPAVSHMVRRIVWKLNAELLDARHPALPNSDHARFFDLAEASALLDRIALLPGMDRAEERARRDLLELFDVFNPLDPLEQTIEQPGGFIHCGVQVLP